MCTPGSTTVRATPWTTFTHSAAKGPEAGLALLVGLDADERLVGHHRLAAVRGHLLEMAGRIPEAIASYQQAAQRTTSIPERRHLQARAARL